MSAEAISQWNEFEDLPRYENPPVIETVLSVQFDPLLDSSHLGLLWHKYRDRFPTFEEKPPIKPAFEIFDRKEMIKFRQESEFTISDIPPLRRCWFIQEDKTRLIQVQNDRFIINWRKVTGNETYISYPNFFQDFQAEYDVFNSFLKQEHLTENFIVNQCEITYVNHIHMPDGQDTHSNFNKIFSYFIPKINRPILPVPENSEIKFRYRILDKDGSPLGRLHVTIEPKMKKDETNIYEMNLTCRGGPLNENIDGITGFFNIGHVWIVNAFDALTTKMMHEFWEKIND
ncbi:MAG TPA: TIGR04255 family protein [bacterium]|jgi:uncharacterized protein (TIGR04255 family)